MYDILQTPEFSEWFDGLDPSTTDRILQVLDRMAQANWGRLQTRCRSARRV